MDNNPETYHWAYEKRINDFCRELAVELRRITGREVNFNPQDLPRRADPRPTPTNQKQ